MYSQDTECFVELFIDLYNTRLFQPTYLKVLYSIEFCTEFFLLTVLLFCLAFCFPCMILDMFLPLPCDVLMILLYFSPTFQQDVEPVDQWQVTNQQCFIKQAVHIPKANCFNLQSFYSFTQVSELCY